MHITAPVSIKDLQQCLGLSDTDLKTLCMSSNVKWYSKYKPTSYSGVGYSLGSDGIEAFHRGAPINYINFGCGLTVPSIAIPITTNVTTPNGTTTLENYLETSQGRYGAYAILSVNASNLGNAWTKSNITVGRLSDFHRYTHSTHQYTNGTKPFAASVALPQSQGRLTIDASAQMFYDYDDVSDGNGCYFLGVNSLFCQQASQGSGGGVSMTINGYTGLRFFTVVVYSPTTGKLLLSYAAFKTITADADSESGLTGNRNVSFPVLSVVGDDFPQGSQVLVAPCILARNIYSQYVLFSLNCEQSASRLITLKGTEPSVQRVHLSSITIKLTYTKVSDRTYDLYINNASDVTLSCTGYTSSSETNKLFFTNNVIVITPADATGSSTSVTPATLGTNYDATEGYRYSNITAATSDGYKLSSSGFSYNIMRTRMTFSGTGTSVRVGITIPVYHNNGSNVMVRKSFNLTFTFNPTTLGTNTVTATAS